MAARATFALKAGVWFRRGRRFMVSPDSQALACPLDREWEEDICADNNADFLYYEVVPLPHADRPDF
jgi:hypothetical protein